MNYCSRCHMRLAAPVGLSGNIHHDRCAPSIKGTERDLTTETSADERGRREIASLLSPVTGLWALGGLDFNHTGGRHSSTAQLRQTGILVTRERRLTQRSWRRDRTVHKRSRYECGAQKYKYATFVQYPVREGESLSFCYVDNALIQTCCDMMSRLKRFPASLPSI